MTATFCAKLRSAIGDLPYGIPDTEYDSLATLVPESQIGLHNCLCLLNIHQQRIHAANSEGTP